MQTVSLGNQGLTFYANCLLRKNKIKYFKMSVNSSPASGDFCDLLITFANSLDHAVLKKLILKKSTDDKKVCKITQQ